MKIVSLDKTGEIYEYQASSRQTLSLLFHYERWKIGKTLIDKLSGKVIMIVKVEKHDKMGIH